MTEELDLRSFVEYVAERVGVKFIYDQSLENRKVRVIAPEPISAETLLQVLHSIVRAEGLAIVDSDIPGWKEIVGGDRMWAIAAATDQPEDLQRAESATPVTQVFTLRHGSPEQTAELLRPTISKAGASLIAVEDRGMLIVTDVAANVRRIAELVSLLDKPVMGISVEFVEPRHLPPAELARQLNELLDARRELLSEQGRDMDVVVRHIEGQSKIALVGKPAAIERVRSVIQDLDGHADLRTVEIELRYARPEELEARLREDSARLYPASRVEVRRKEQSLIVTGSPEIVDLALRLRQQIDSPSHPVQDNPIRFYKVKNVPAEELLQTIQSIFTGQVTQRRPTLPRGNRQPALPLPPARGVGSVVMDNRQEIARSNGETTRRNATVGTGELSPDDSSSELLAEPAPGLVSGVAPELIGAAQVTVDIHTNSIIVIAEPPVQRIYESLIRQLDQRRPQVLVEAKIVIIDTSDGYTLGVEIAGGDRSGTRKAFAFTSYGFSTVDAVTGALQLTPGVGFNGTLVDPSTANLVIRALSTHRRARVLSAPRILVNDNAVGELTSVLEIPFTSVNASQTVATTSFAGFAEAGTTITVTPTVSEDGYLQLEYTVTLNTFTGEGSEGVPPPRQTNEVRSRVTVPDGYTVIVGGLTSKNSSETYRGLPWIENIPLVRQIAGTTTSNATQTSLFVFLRPVVLQDDRFRDLKYLSLDEARASGSSADAPAMRPMTIR